MTDMMPADCFPLQIGFAQLGSVLGVKLGSVISPKPHFSRAFPNFWRAVYVRWQIEQILVLNRDGHFWQFLISIIHRFQK